MPGQPRTQVLLDGDLLRNELHSRPDQRVKNILKQHPGLLLDCKADPLKASPDGKDGIVEGGSDS